MSDAFFDGAPSHSDAHDPPEDRSLASYLYDGQSPLFNGLHSADDHERAVHCMRNFSGWTGAELEDVSLRYWAFTPDIPGPDVLVTGGQYHKVMDHLARDCDIRLDSEVTSIKEDTEHGASSCMTLG